MSNAVDIIATVSTVVVAVSQGAALFGKPKIVEKLTLLSAFLDLLAGNYGKAKNRASADSVLK